jgi:Fe-Mn family superoxide dismutase
MEAGFYELPKLKFGYDALVPHMSEEQLKLHHTKHHQAYVDNSNNLLKKLDAAAKEGTDLDMKALSKELSFNVAGHTLHSYFWENLAPPGKGGDRPGGALADAIAKDFGSLDRFKKVFSQAANSVEGSGWAVLSYSPEVKRLTIMQVEKHNVNVFPTYPVLMLLDLWEHAYYVDYKNARAKFTEAYWNIVNWDAAGKWFARLL